MKFALLGNSPSSGSTFLADLLDSTNYSACGEEIGFFSNKHLYNFSSFKKKPKYTSNFFALYFPRTFWHENIFHYYGLNTKDLLQMIQNSESFNCFCSIFSERYLALRGKDSSGIVFEKTPENTNVIGEFLSQTENNYFINIVRNPFFVYLSLKKRGFSENIALVNWMFEAAKSSQFINHDRVITIKYEDLIKEPYKITSDIIYKCSGNRVTEENIKLNYENNNYRKLFSIKLSSWSSTSFGKVSNANTSRDIDKIEFGSFSKISRLKISKAYAKIFNIPDLSFLELASVYGYQFNFEHIDCSENIFEFTKQEKKKLFTKWKRNFKEGEASISELRAYLNPISVIK